MRDVFVGILFVVGTLPAALLVRGVLWCGLAIQIKKWNKTTGTVIEINETDDKIVFAYDVGNEQYTGTNSPSAGYKMGDRIALCYNPMKPKDYLVTQDWTPSKLGPISMGIGGLDITFLVGCYFLLRRIF